MPALSASFDQLIDEVPGLGYKITATVSTAAATATTTSEIVAGLGSQESSDVLNTRGLWIPSAAAAADQFRVVAVGGYAFAGAGSVVTLTFTNTSNFGENLTNVTAYLLAAGITPDDIINLANDSLDRLSTDVLIPLKDFGDDLQGSTVDTDWTESGATDTVDQTASKVGVYGRQILDVLDSGAGGGYTQNALSDIPQGARVRIHGFVQSITGTNTLSAVDGSGNVQDSISTTQRAPMYLSKEVTFDAADEQARLRLVATTASAQGYWNGAWGVLLVNNPRFDLPSWVEGRFRVKAVSYWRFTYAGSEADTWYADSYEELRLNEGQHFRYGRKGGAANPHALYILDEGRRYLDYPLFITVTCAYSELYGADTTFTSYSSTNPCPTDELVPHMMMLAGDRWGDSFPDAFGRGLRKLRERLPQRPAEVPPQPSYGGPREV